MAQTLAELNTTYAFTLGLTGVATKFTPPPFTKFLWLQFRSSAGGVAKSGTDGATISTDYFLIKADDMIEIQHDGDHPFFLAGTADDVECSIEARGW